MSVFTIGTDIEFFLKKGTKYVSAIGYIAGSKDSPLPLSNGGVVIHDNVALEVATPVAANKEEFIDAVRTSVTDALSGLPKDIKLSSTVSVDFPKKELLDDEAQLFGCSPDFDAWELMINTVPYGAEQKPFRCVGGHLHLGFVTDSGNDFLLDPMGKVTTVKLLDLLLGIPMTIIDQEKGSKERRELYGKAGCHRPTDYGVEYRALSNYWTTSPVLVALVYDIAATVLSLMANGKAEEALALAEASEIQHIINECDIEGAYALFNKVSKLYGTELCSRIEQTFDKTTIEPYKEWRLDR